MGQGRVKVIAEVKTSKKEGKKTYGVGLQFLIMDKAVEAELHSFIDFLKQKQR